MIWHFLSQPLAFVFFFFFKSIRVWNKSILNTPGPALLILNHPSAFTDPIAFTYVFYPLRTHYLAGGIYFRSSWAAFFLKQLGIIPIYRIQDGGKSGLKNNDITSARVIEALKQGKKVMIFAEGVSVQDRRLKPIKKGAARLAFEAQEALGTSPLHIIPIGVNYSDPSRFRSRLIYHIGEPISVLQYLPAYRQQPAKAQYDMIQRIYQHLVSLVIHVEPAQCQTVIPLVEKLLPQSTNAYDFNWRESKRRADAFNTLTVVQQEALEHKSLLYTKACLNHGLQEMYARQYPPYVPLITLVTLLCIGLLAWPGIMLHAPVIAISRWYACNKVKHKEFYTSVLLTFVLGSGMVWYAVFFTLGYCYSGSVFIGFCTLIAFLSFGIISIGLIDLLRLQWQNWKWFRLKKSEQQYILTLKTELLQALKECGFVL